MNVAVTYNRMAQALLVVGPLASLAVSPNTSFDPISLIKVVIIASIAFYCLGLLLSSARYSAKRLGNFFWLSAGLFILSMLSTFLFSGAPINQQFWGTFGRNTGFLTYLSLVLILISTALIQKAEFYNRLVNSIIITALPMTIYCLVQIAGLDPVAWSEKSPFGTLGNINFSSAFFGFSSICATILILEKKFSIILRICFFILVLIDMGIVLKTGSIQGFMVYIAAIGISILLFIRSKESLRILRIPYILLGIFGVIFVVLGLSNKGPFAKFLFAPSIVFRTDYWHAGWQMTLNKPFFGVGLDSYGDWYRSARGVISTLRTGPDRVANTAHNIFLDISSNGGVPLIAAYLALNFIAFRASIRILKRDTSFQPYFVAIFCTWFGYIIFSAISINQVGVGIWGWLFTGALIGYEKIDRISVNQRQTIKSKRFKKGSSLSPVAGISAFTSLVVGFTLSYIPFNADVKYKNALNRGAMDGIIQRTQTLGSTGFHNEMALDLAIKNNFTSQIDVLTRQLVKNYPLDFMGWRAMLLLQSATSEEKAKATEMIKSLDPFNPAFSKS